jgi:hypothetical protein
LKKEAKRKILKKDLSKKGSKSAENYKGIDELVNVIVNDKIKLSDQNNIKPWFSLNPPKGGFKKKTKKQFSDGGVLGNNKDLLEIVKKMI